MALLHRGQSGPGLSETRIFSDATDFYPASGHLDSGSGGLYFVGTRGSSWSSAPVTVGSMDGSALYFDDSVASPEVSNRRSYGFPVRCVAE